MGFLSWYGWYWFLFYTLRCGNSIAVSGFLFTRLEESRTRWRWRWLHRRILSLPHPFPSSLSISMCAPHSAVSIFIVKVKMENGKCKRMLHFSLHSPSIRFYHPQWTFSICGPARLCFLLLKWFHILSLSLSLYCSLALFCSGFMQFLRISCALLNILTGVSGSQQGICLLSTAQKDFLSGHWAVVWRDRTCEGTASQAIRIAALFVPRNLSSFSCHFRGISCCFWLDLLDIKYKLHK